MQRLKLPAWIIGDRGFEPRSGIQVSKKQHVSSPITREDSILWGASLTGRAVSSRLSHHPREVLLAQFSIHVHKSGLKPHSFHL